jgi:undecaprenyl-diphosphatase
MADDALPAPDELPVAERLREQVRAFDETAYQLIAEADMPRLDPVLRGLSQAANKSALWFAVAGALAAAGGPRGRRAALSGAAAIGLASSSVNLVFKGMADRRRPDREGVPAHRHVPMPESTSFPSGHSASAFAFATAVTRELPVAGVVLVPAAAAVAFSRVHTGVHHPSDVIVGSGIGVVAGLIGSSIARRLLSARGR